MRRVCVFYRGIVVMDVFWRRLYLFIYIIHIAIYGIHVTKQVTLKIQLEY